MTRKEKLREYVKLLAGTENPTEHEKHRIVMGKHWKLWAANEIFLFIFAALIALWRSLSIGDNVITASFLVMLIIFILILIEYLKEAREIEKVAKESSK